MFQRALICTDFSDGLQRLVNLVPSLVAGGLQQIVFLHVLSLTNEGEIPREDPQKTEEARDRLAPALSHVPEGVEVKIEVAWGKPTDQILRMSKAYTSDLIILGMSSHNLLTEKLFGSTTMDLCQRRIAAIFSLRPQMVSTYTYEELELRCQHLFRYLLLPYDGSETSQSLVSHVKQYAQKQSVKSLARCLLCWVVDEVNRSKELETLELQQAHDRLATAKAELEGVGLQVETQLRVGNPVTQVLMAAQEHDISAIAVSSGTLGKPLGWSVTSVTAEILRRSWHPVLYVPIDK
jgi:nucleotide-binding universal stress UspA family protein